MDTQRTDRDAYRNGLATERLPDAIRRSHDRLCTVSRTVELGTPVDTR